MTDEQRTMGLLVASLRGDEEGQLTLLDEIGQDRRDVMRHLVLTLDFLQAIFGDDLGRELADKFSTYAVKLASEGTVK